MNNEKFTAGEWIISHGFIRIIANERAICTMHGKAEKGKTRVANANLIVGSPKMYAALKMVSQSAFFDELPALTQNAVLDALSKANPK